MYGSTNKFQHLLIKNKITFNLGACTRWKHFSILGLNHSQRDISPNLINAIIIIKRRKMKIMPIEK